MRALKRAPRVKEEKERRGEDGRSAFDGVMNVLHLHGDVFHLSILATRADAQMAIQKYMPKK